MDQVIYTGKVIGLSEGFAEDNMVVCVQGTR